MTLLKKRLLLTTIIGLLICSVAVAFFYRPTRLALERAESLQFRRLLVTRSDQGFDRFFFVTNRAVEKESGPLAERFGNKRQQELSFGVFDTEIEPSLGLGMLINPTDWFQNEEIRVHSVTPLKSDDFVKQLRDQVQNSPFNSLLININGFREQFPSAIRKTAFLAHVLDINTPVLAFDWPGNQGSSPLGYLRSQRVAEESASELATTIKLLVKHIEPQRIWLVANSMGAQVVVHAFSQLYGDQEFADLDTELEKVILTAPDVDRERFNNQFKSELSSLTDNLTVYVSSNDRALLMSRVLNRGRRLGESTLDPLNPNQLEEASAIFEMMEPDDQLVTLVDVTPINRTRNFHNFSLETPEFFDDLYLRLVNRQMPRSRPEYTVRADNGNIYWVLTQAR